MIGILKGFGVTFKNLIGPGINRGYPQVAPQLPERSRGSVALMFGEDGEMLCKACQLCARNCPDDALHLETEKPPEGGRAVLTGFTLDLGRCMLCGLCVESCPANSLTMTPEFEHATADPADMIRVLYRRPPEQ
jgi:NADH-quinone oxidoreductase subunit I